MRRDSRVNTLRQFSEQVTTSLAQNKLVDAILPAGLLPKPILVQKVTLSSESGVRNSRLALIVP
jgi:hypothetical protein